MGMITITSLSIKNLRNSPDSYEGTSGGGLWQVTLKRDESQNIVADDVILRGVVFYQHPLVEGKTGLRCHGYKSIYDIAYSALSRPAP